MIDGLKPYPEYKGSGLMWIDRVPAHWDLLPNRVLMRRRKVLVGARHSEYRLLSLTREGVIIRDIESGKGKFSADMGTSQEVRVGDLVFCLFDVPQGYQNARKNTPNTARLEHDKALQRIMVSLLKDDTELYKQFVQNDSFRRFVTDMVYAITNA